MAMRPSLVYVRHTSTWRKEIGANGAIVAKIRQKKNLQDARDVREIIKSLLRPHLTSEASRRRAAEATGLTYNTIGSMLYSENRGGIRSWQLLFLHVHELDPERWDALLVELKEFLRRRTKMTPGERAWASLGDEMSEDELLYHAEVARCLRAIREPLRKK